MIYDDLSDTGFVPKNSSDHVISFNPQEMEWQLKSFNSSSNSSVSAVFHLSSYQGSETPESTNVEVMVKLLIVLRTSICFESF